MGCGPNSQALRNSPHPSNTPPTLRTLALFHPRDPGTAPASRRLCRPSARPGDAATGPARLADAVTHDYGCGNSNPPAGREPRGPESSQPLVRVRAAAWTRGQDIPQPSASMAPRSAMCARSGGRAEGVSVSADGRAVSRALPESPTVTAAGEEWPGPDIRPLMGPAISSAERCHAEWGIEGGRRRVIGRAFGSASPLSASHVSPPLSSPFLSRPSSSHVPDQRGRC